MASVDGSRSLQGGSDELHIICGPCQTNKNIKVVTKFTLHLCIFVLADMPVFHINLINMFYFAYRNT